ncbi:hypothetical protein RIF29_29511 [Crotalaria pallida]|uniref:Uncharacterized protein n=1 Tax=Crotalaria pallida TaxID=3830 RepID=A0AAN9EEW1_CROPI
MDDGITDVEDEKETNQAVQVKPSFREVVMHTPGFQPNAKEIIKIVQEELCPFLEEELRAKEANKELDLKPVIEVGSTAVSDQPPGEGANIPTVSQATNGEFFAPQINVELTKEDPCFGPWMLAKNPNRRKNLPKFEERRVVNEVSKRGGSRFAVLEDDSHVSLSTVAPPLDPCDNQQKNVGLSSKVRPKQTKVASSKPMPRKTKLNPDKLSSQPPKVSSIPSLLPTGSSPAKDSLKQKEANILRMMSWKEKELLKAFNESKSSMDFMNQFAINPSEEVLIFVDNVRARDVSLEVLNSKPPNSLKNLDCKLGGEGAQDGDVGAVCSQICDGAATSTG